MSICFSTKSKMVAALFASTFLSVAAKSQSPQIFDKKDIITREKEKELISKLSISSGLSVEQIESEIASDYEKAEAFMKVSNGGYSQGVHFIGAPLDISSNKKQQNRKEINELSINKIEFVPLSKIINDSAKYSIQKGSLFNKRMTCFTPVDIEQTKLSSYNLEGFALGGTFLPGIKDLTSKRLIEVRKGCAGKAEWTTLTRIFRHKYNLFLYELKEDDVSAADMTVLVPADKVNFDINEKPAILSKDVNKFGDIAVSITWFPNPEKVMTLSANGSSSSASDDLIELAKSIMVETN